MQKWRYHTLIIRDLSIAEAKLNAEGEKGWELVSVIPADVHGARAFFKMPLEEDAPAMVVPTTHDVALVPDASLGDVIGLRG